GAGAAQGLCRACRRADPAIEGGVGGDKEHVARDIAVADAIETGLVCLLTAVEPSVSYEIGRDRGARSLRMEPRQRTACISTITKSTRRSASSMPAFRPGFRSRLRCASS